MSPQNLTNVYNQNPTLQGQYTLQQYLDLFGGSSTTPPPTTTQPVPTPNPPTKGIINQNINQYQSGGGGYNPYMPNANVNTNYNSRPAYEAAFGKNMGDPMANISTGALNSSGVMGDYREKPPSAGAQFINKALNYVPGIGGLKRGAEFLGSALGGIMPVNQRAILENELRGSGVFTDDIGRIAIGPDGKYNTPEGIMSGYNANKMTDKTFDKRTGNIGQSLQNKTSLTEQQINDIVNEIAETGKYSGDLTDEDLGVKNLFSNLVNVNMAKFNFKNTKTKQQKIIDFQNKEKERKKKEKEALELKAAIEKANQPYSGPTFYNRNDDGSRGSAISQDFQNTTASLDNYDASVLRAKGGLMGRGGSRRTSYFNGGIVSLRRR